MVDFPQIKFEVTCISPHHAEKSQHLKYNQFGVINHLGNDGEGHYTVCLKQDGSWYVFDDTNIILLEEKEVVSQDSSMLIYIISR